MEITLEYLIGGGLNENRLNKIISLSEGIKKKIDDVRNEGGILSMEASLSDGHGIYYWINFEGAPEKITNVVADFMDNNGIPDIIYGNNKFIEGYLKQNGKKLKRNFLGLTDGYIIDLRR